MTTLITAEKALSLLEDAVALKGRDYVYPVMEQMWRVGCHYTRDGEPSCGVGYALHAAGVSIEGLAMLDDNDENAIDSEEIRYTLRNDLDFIVTDEAVEVFTAFQRFQDKQHGWGESLDEAKRVASALPVSV